MPKTEDKQPKQTDIRKYSENKAIENRINFSHNWNKFGEDGGKLNNKFFTTIRNIDKANYYMLRTSEVFSVFLNDKFFCRAYLHDATIYSFEDIKTPELFILDTGTMDYINLFQKFGVVKSFVLLLFERLEVQVQ
jgi:hypothetical protein